MLGVFAGVFLQFPLGNLAYQEVLRAVVPFPNRDRKIGTVKNRAYHGGEKKRRGPKTAPFVIVGITNPSYRMSVGIRKPRS